MILAVGYRVKSPNGIIFRKWATSILNDYMFKGYVINYRQIISNSALVAITLMIAESRPEEKETIVKLVMNFLN